MATLLPKNGEIFSYAGTAPSPSKDYCQLVITLNEVINNKLLNETNRKSL